MSMYFVEIDISKYKHDCCIISAASRLFLNLPLPIINKAFNIY